MEYTLNEKYALIKERVSSSGEKNPVKMAQSVMKEGFINIHGPEHHFLDGACFLAAYKNAGGKLDIEKALDALAERTIKMPGAACGLWGVCGAVSSVGAALAVINETGPLTSNEFYSHNMEFTSAVLSRMSKIGGPRCCKRNAFLSLKYITQFVKDKYGVEMDSGSITCDFSPANKQCLKEKCPFYSGR